ncbi:MAG: hypothetical protein Q7S65_03085 [Nanoarchaeota archaeon]|nr:hypothetical protein [Nanoarchaeota archaeon]
MGVLYGYIGYRGGVVQVHLDSHDGPIPDTQADSMLEHLAKHPPATWNVAFKTRDGLDVTLGSIPGRVELAARDPRPTLISPRELPLDTVFDYLKRAMTPGSDRSPERIEGGVYWRAVPIRQTPSRANP